MKMICLEHNVTAVIFDLDDTLYEHACYVAGAYRDVACAAQSATGVSKNVFFDRAWALYRECGPRDNTIFSTVLCESGAYSKAAEEKLVRTYRLHRPAIEPLPGVRAGLLALRAAHIRVGLLTDGQPETQLRKLDALGLRSLLDEVVVTGELGAASFKPARAGFDEILRRLGAGAAESVYVGDDPVVDVVGALSVGMRAVRVRQGWSNKIDSAQPCMEYGDIGAAMNGLLERITD